MKTLLFVPGGVLTDAGISKNYKNAKRLKSTRFQVRTKLRQHAAVNTVHVRKKDIINDDGTIKRKNGHIETRHLDFKPNVIRKIITARKVNDTD